MLRRELLRFAVGLLLAPCLLNLLKIVEACLDNRGALAKTVGDLGEAVQLGFGFDVETVDAVFERHAGGIREPARVVA